MVSVWGAQALPALSHLGTAYNLSIPGQVLFLLIAAGISVDGKWAGALASSALVGTIVGQLFFGFLGDVIGGRKGLALALSLMIISGLLSAILPWGATLLPTLVFWRFVVGIAAGGVYPLAALVSSASCSDEHRGRDMILAFSFQGWGQLLAPTVVLLIDTLLSDYAFVSWRIALIVGVIPPVIALPKALFGPQTARVKTQKKSQFDKPIYVELVEHRNSLGESNSNSNSNNNNNKSTYLLSEGEQSLADDVSRGGDELMITNGHMETIELDEIHGNNNNNNNFSAAAVAAADDNDNDDDIQQQQQQRIGIKAAALHLFRALGTYEYQRKLFGTAGGWFLFDVVFYGNIIFSPFVLKIVLNTSSDSDDYRYESGNEHTSLNQSDSWNGTGLIGAAGMSGETVAAFNALLALLALPGLYLSSWLADSWGRKRIQLQAFSVISILFFTLGMTHDTMAPGVLFAFYALTFFFYNFGPNATTFCLPSETFPSEVRSVMSGLSAAAGKVGAVVSAMMFKPILDSMGFGAVAFGCAIVAALGAIVTAIFVEDRRGLGMATSSTPIEILEMEEEADEEDRA